MNTDHPMKRHTDFTPFRAKAYEELFECKPILIFPYHDFSQDTDLVVIDVFVYRIAVNGHSNPVYVMVTNGMSDNRMTACDPDESMRCEIIQYVHEPNNKHYARSIYDIAWLPHYDKFCLRSKDTIAWRSTVNGVDRFTNSLVLDPIWSRHQQVLTRIVGDETRLLWHVPITELEYQFKENNGADALLDRMDACNIGWIFDPNRQEIC